MKFSLKDKTSGNTITAHQTFVKLTNAKTKQEIIFVAEADSSNNYKFDLVNVVFVLLFQDQCMYGLIFCHVKHLKILKITWYIKNKKTALHIS